MKLVICQNLLLVRCFMLLFAFIMAPAVVAADNNEEPPVGWCTFYPAFPAGEDVIGQSGASILSVIQSGWGIWSKEEKIDFDPMDLQIELAAKNNLSLALISETNPVYSQAWMNERVKAAGQSIVDGSGNPGDIPTISSPIFREGQDKLIREIAAHVKQADKNGIIKYYHPGCEWWFPHSYRYNKLEVDNFKSWLKKKYGNIANLNKQWESKYKSFNDVQPPMIDTIQGSETELSRLITSNVGEQHCSWSLGASTAPDAPEGSLAIVEPNKTYTISAWIKTKDISGPGVFVEVAWISPNGGPPISGAVSTHLTGSNDWTYVQFNAKAPSTAGRAWILLKTAATGTAWFDDVSVCEEGSDVNLAPNPGFESGTEYPLAWSFQAWTNGDNITENYLSEFGRNGSKCVCVDISDTNSSFGNIDAAVYDWSTFWYEYAADYINYLSGIYKKYDTERPTVSYLTFSFGYPAEWDYSQQMSIAPDEVAYRGSNLDVIGMQICAADGDPYRATAALDLVRKYEKPMWAVDLIDFTSGVYIGFSKMNKISQSVIQHGAKGIIYCLWNLPPVPDYSFYPNWPVEDSNRMLTNAKESIKLLDGYTIKPDIALVQPILPASSLDADGFKNDYRSFMGWYKILENLHLTFDIVTLKELERDDTVLSKYKFIIAPDCKYIAEKSLNKLTAYTESGGKMITGGQFGEFNEISKPLPKSKANACNRIRLADYGKAYTGVLIRGTHAGNTPPLFLWGDNTPVRQKIMDKAHKALSDVINPSNTKGLVSIYPRNDMIKSVIHENGKKKAIFLVNMDDKSPDTHFIRIYDSLDCKVKAYADNKEVEVDTQLVKSEIGKSFMAIKLPKFETSCIIFME